MSFLQYRPNTCTICLICLICTETYGKNCTCPSKELKWQRKSKEYQVDFRHRSIDKVSANKNKKKFDHEFVSWFRNNISPSLEMPEDQHDANICKNCINKYDYYKRSIYDIFFFI